MPVDTALHKASHGGDLKQVKTLIEGGTIDVNAPGAADRRALHRAAGGNHVDVCNYLISHGAIIDQADKTGRTPLHWASISGNSITALLLIEQGADVFAATETKMTPLHVSAEIGNVEIVDLLISKAGERKKDMFNATSEGGKTAAALAKEGNHKLVIKKLKELGDSNAASSSTCTVS